MSTLPNADLTKPLRTLLLILLRLFFYGDGTLSHHPTGVGWGEWGVGTGIAICLAFRPKEPAQKR